MELLRRYGMPMQEMPLLCRRFLEAQEGELPEHVDYTEEAMKQYAGERVQESEARQLKRGRTGKPTSTKRRTDAELSQLGGASNAVR